MLSTSYECHLLGISTPFLAQFYTMDAYSNDMVSVILGLLPTQLNQMWGRHILDRATTYLDKFLLERFD